MSNTITGLFAVTAYMVLVAIVPTLYAIVLTLLFFLYGVRVARKDV